MHDDESELKVYVIFMLALLTLFIMSGGLYLFIDEEEGTKNVQELKP